MNEYLSNNRKLKKSGVIITDKTIEQKRIERELAGIPRMKNLFATCNKEAIKKLKSGDVEGLRKLEKTR